MIDNRTGLIRNADLRKHQITTYFIAAVWIVNGLFCKTLQLVPRHQLIVARILGNDFSGQMTLLIGISEIGMAVWILSNIKTRLNSILQIALVAAMNILEFILAPDLLLWGKFNLLFAFMFVLLIYYNEFHFNKNNQPD